MKMTRCGQSYKLLSLVLLLLCGPALAQPAMTVPPGGQLLIGSDQLDAFSQGPSKKGAVELVRVEGQPFAKAIRLVSNERGYPWDMQSGQSLDTSFKKGDALLFHGWLRTINTRHESGQGIATVKVGLTRSPWTPMLEREITIGDKWQEFFIPGTATGDFVAGDIGLSVMVGSVQQTIEFGGVELLNYGSTIKADQLPRTRSTYAGREADAAWRADAERRIVELRMAPLAIRVIDEDGRPVEGARVDAKLVRHAFEFGAAVDQEKVARGNDPAADLYRTKFLELFNAGSFYNALKWQAWTGEWGKSFSRDITFAALRWFKENDLPFRGHVLVWPSWGNLPEEMKRFKMASPDAAAMQSRVLAHIDDITAATSEYVDEWDVLNEPRDNHDLMDIGGRQVMVEWFKRARLRLPNAKLALNDYAILTTLADGPTQQAFEDNARFLLDNGAPLDVLGFQGHFGATVPPPNRVLAVLDRFAKLGKPIRITEYTIAGDDADLQRDFTRDVIIAAFSHPSVIGFQFWGMESVVNEDGSLSPVGEAYRSLVNDRWRTNVVHTTGSDGRIADRGFKGRYEIAVSKDDRAVKVVFDLRNDVGECIIVLDDK